MELVYASTRDAQERVTASQAILRGLANDGGLFVPTQIPALDVPMEELGKMSYQETAYEVMKRFLTDFTEEELKHCINSAYDSKFDTEEIAPLVEADGAYYLELFHGSTIAFKDMALSILPYLLTTAAKKNHVKNEIVILTATSGDTGKAALAGFSDVPGTKIIVFYPKNGVSPIQEKQMVTQKGDNTFVVGIHGNFDQAQTGVKKMFSDAALAKEMDAAGYQFSSANSINIGRLVPQIVYYVYAYAKLYANGVIAKDEPVNVVVPTGNFGNILAAFYAKNMGIPIAKLKDGLTGIVCAIMYFRIYNPGRVAKNAEPVDIRRLIWVISVAKCHVSRVDSVCKVGYIVGHRRVQRHASSVILPCERLQTAVGNAPRESLHRAVLAEIICSYISKGIDIKMGIIPRCTVGFRTEYIQIQRETDFAAAIYADTGRILVER